MNIFNTRKFTILRIFIILISITIIAISFVWLFQQNEKVYVRRKISFTYTPAITSSNNPAVSTTIPAQSQNKANNGSTPSLNAQGILHANGSQIVDSKGNNIVLKGAMIETSFAYIKQWEQGRDPLDSLNTRTFNVMSKDWKMNVLRTNISRFIYEKDPATYMSKLNTAINDATSSGLYVILDYHDDGQSGNPAPDGMLHSQDLEWWKIIASSYKNNPMVMFDPINEPHYTNWQTWLNGNRSDVAGYQAAVDTIRSTGAQQAIIVEPGSAGGKSNPEEDGWATLGNIRINDNNIFYSKHDYQKLITGNSSTWDREWGPLLNKYPLFYGEWAVLPNSLNPSHCTGLTPTNADQITNSFLSYLNSRKISWTAWDFKPSHLIINTSSYTPTSFSGNWSCGDQKSTAGMGQDVKNYLTGISTP